MVVVSAANASGPMGNFPSVDDELVSARRCSARETCSLPWVDARALSTRLANASPAAVFPFDSSELLLESVSLRVVMLWIAMLERCTPSLVAASKPWRSVTPVVFDAEDSFRE